MSNCQDKPYFLSSEQWERLKLLPAFRYLKAPVDNEAQLYEKYPTGNEHGTFAFVHDENTFYVYHPRGIFRGRWKPIAGGIESFFEINAEFLKEGDVLVYDSNKKKFVVKSGNVWNKLLDKASSFVQTAKFLNEVEEIPTIESDSGVYFIHKNTEVDNSIVEFRALYIVLDTLIGKKVVKIWNSTDYYTATETQNKLNKKANQTQVDDIAASVDVLAVTKAEKSVVEALMNGIIKQPAVDTYNDTSDGQTSLLNQYPNPQKGWDVLVRKENTRYNWNGSIWVNMETDSYDREKTARTEYLNVSQYNNKYDYINSTIARNAVPADLRCLGQQIVYQLTGGIWIIEKYTGTTVNDWEKITNWEKVLSTKDSADFITYNLPVVAAQSILFSKMVRAVYTTGKTLTSSQKLRITYFGLSSPNFQSYPFGIQVALVENGVLSKQTSYVYPYNTDLKNNAVLQLTAPIENATELFDEGLRIYIVLSNQYESLVSQTFDSTVIDLTQGSYNWYLNPLLKKYITEQTTILNNTIAQTKTDLSNLIEETATGGNTYKVFTQGDPVVQFEKSVSEVYITGGDKRANRIFEIRYFGLKAPAFQNADLGIQIATRKEDNSGWLTPANYNATGTLVAGSLIKLNTTDPNAVQGIDVYVKLATTYVKPTDTYLQYIANYLQLTSVAWNNFIPLAIQNKFDSITKGNITEIIVSADESDTEAAFKGVNAIQLALNSITDASSSNRYRIYVKRGLYKITNSSQFIGYAGYPSMIVPKDHVDIVCQSKEDCVIHAELPYNDADIDTNISRNLHQTMYNWADDSTIENARLVSKYIRYTLHQDNPNEANKTRTYKNVDFIFLGDKGFDNALGIGTYSGSRTFVDGGRSQAYTHPPVAIHNNQNFKKPSEWHFKDHEFINSKGDAPGFIYMTVCGSLVSDKLELIGCSFGSSYIFNYAENWIYTPNKNDSFNHAEWRVTGHGNAPFYFKNTVKGLSLRIDASEGYKNIRIDTTSTAYASLLKNPHGYFGHLGHPERYISGGYIVFDSYQATKGYVIGALSIYEGTYPNGTTQSVDGLGKRLGDCSVTNKELKLTVGSDAVTITFNKNYTNMTNAAIITEINTALGSYAIASEYNISLDYYPELTDVMSVCVNGTTSIIPKGTPVSLLKDRIVPATEGGQLFGIALDDFVPFNTYLGSVRGYGRVLRRGYISTVNTDRFFVKVDSQSTSYRVGNATLIADANGSIKTIDSGIVGINI